MYLNSCKNSLILNINSSIILNQCCACSAQENKTAHYQRVVKEQRHSASKCLVLLFPLLPVSLSLQGQAQNHTSCTASSLALFHLLKGWIQILTFAMEKQNFSTNLEINCWHFSPFSPLMCEEKNKYLWRLKGRWVGEEQPSEGRGWCCRAEATRLPWDMSSLVIAPNERATAVLSEVRLSEPACMWEVSEKSFISLSHCSLQHWEGSLTPALHTLHRNRCCLNAAPSLPLADFL